MTEKTERFTVKLLPTDKQALERLANEEGESMAFVIRKLIRQAREQQNTTVSVQPHTLGVNHAAKR
jgi:hypothetical protein